MEDPGALLGHLRRLREGKGGEVDRAHSVMGDAVGKNCSEEHRLALQRH